MSTDPRDDQLVTHDDLPEIDEQNPEDVLAELSRDEDHDLLRTAADSQAAGDTEQDLSVDDLLQDGADMQGLESGNRGRREYEADLADPGHDDTIDERMRQEEPEPGFDVVRRGPGDAAR